MSVRLSRLSVVGAFLLLGFVFPSFGSRVAHLSIGGIDYVRLDQWAESQRMSMRWTTPKQEARVFSTWSSLSVSVDSRRCQLNGVTVWLSYPVASRNGALWISRSDLATAINPVLFPARSGSRRVQTICIDAGHGGKDPGNRESRQQEKTYTLALAKELSKQLSTAGFNVVMTRTSDSFVDLPIRPDLARKRRADLFLSLHFNSAGSASARNVQGAEVYCLTPARASSTNAGGEGAGTGAFLGNRHDSQNMLLAHCVQRALTGRLGAEDRGVKRARFAVLRSAEMPAVLIEGGFMTNPSEARKIYDPAYRRKMAQAIVEAVVAYRKALQEPT